MDALVLRENTEWNQYFSMVLGTHQSQPILEAFRSREILRNLYPKAEFNPENPNFLAFYSKQLRVKQKKVAKKVNTVLQANA